MVAYAGNFELNKDMEAIQDKRRGVRNQCVKLCDELRVECDQVITDDSWRRIEAKFARLSLRECELERLNELTLESADDKFFKGPGYEKELEETDKFGYIISETKMIVEAVRPVKEEEAVTTKVSGNKGTTVKLPKLEMPTFDGDVTSYQPFIQSFDETIDANQGLSDLDKFKYLKSFVKGDAARVLKPIPVRADNYELAKDTLKNNFGQVDTITQAHLQAINEVKPVADAEHISSLREVLNHLEFHVRSIQNLGVKPKEYNLLLFHKVSSILPKEIMLEYCRQERPAEVDALIAWLRKEIASRSRCQLLSHKSEYTREKTTKPMRTTAALFTGTEEAEVEVGAMAASVSETTQRLVNKRNEPRPFCVLCVEPGHWTDACTVKRTWVEKRTILSRRGRCFRCGSRDHMSRECKNPRCVCDRCKGRHLSIFCPMQDGVETEVREVTSMSVQSRPLSTPVEYNLLQTAHALAGDKGKERDVRVLLDGGSQCSFIRESTSKLLGLVPFSTIKIKLNTFGGVAERKKCGLVWVPLKTREREQVCLVQALVVSALSIQGLPYAAEETRRQCDVMGLALADQPIWPAAREVDEIDILIGVDSYWKIVQGPMRQVSDNLMAMFTRFGWVLLGTQGVLVQEPRTDERDVCVQFVQARTEPETDWDHLWRFDMIGVPDSPKKKEEFEAVEVVKEKDGYRVNLPWLVDRRHRLSNNVEIAQQRLHALLMKLQRNEGMLEIYHEAVKKYVVDGHAEKAPPSTMDQPGYFLPHRAVMREGTSTDVRIVFDASSRAPQELSLNQCIYAGDDRRLDVIGVLLRFRKNKWAMISDIKQAFLQIHLDKGDQKFLKFLWLDVEQPLTCPYQVREYCMNRVTFGVNASPYLLRLVITHHLRHYPDTEAEFVRRCLRDLYVDDEVISVTARERLDEEQRKLSRMFKAGGFNLRKWATNDVQLKAEWRARGVEIEENPIVKVLGQFWDTESDTMWVKINKKKAAEGQVKTKRAISSLVASVFDPLGIMSLITIKAKIMMQTLWQERYDWDTVLKEDLQHEWEEWGKELFRCLQVKIPRWCGFREEWPCELHCFCDASAQAFGMILFTRQIDIDGKVQVKFQTARYRVAPLREAEIPDLELLSAVLAVRVTNYWKSEMEIEPQSTYWWTDSDVVLQWVQHEDRIRREFIQKRIEEIRRSTKVSEWRHCPGCINPADKATRKMERVSVEQIEKWMVGPLWLENKDEWPSVKFFPKGRTETKVVTCVTVKPIEYVIEADRIGSWLKLLRVTCLCLRFIHGCRERRPRGRIISKVTGDELRMAELLWIECIQRRWYSDELRCLQDNRSLIGSSVLKKLNVFLDDDGVIRLDCRLQNAAIRPEVQSPIVLPGGDEVVEKYIVHRHECMWHVGVGGLLTDIRRKFWITKGRRACKRVVSRCLVCVRYHSGRFQPKVGQLPVERTQPGVAFSTIGIDFAGPFYLRQIASEKVYILLITCFYSRAVHIEVLSNLTTECFMLAWQRYMARRGQPSVVYSDNALTYKKASRIMRQILSTTVSIPKYSFFKLDVLEWKFIPEKAPWMGGLWERMIRSVKIVMRKVLGGASLTFEELTTALCVVESVINSRPLTYVAEDGSDDRPLTPNQLISGRMLCALPMYDLSVVSEINFMARYKYVNSLLQHFSRRWLREYLLNLSSRHVWEGGSEYVPKVGDVVLIERDDAKRQLYPVGRIISLRQGRDQVVRSANLRLPHGSTICRPLRRLFPLEPQQNSGGSVSNAQA